MYRVKVKNSTFISGSVFKTYIDATNAIKQYINNEDEIDNYEIIDTSNVSFKINTQNLPIYCCALINNKGKLQNYFFAAGADEEKIRLDLNLYNTMEEKWFVHEINDEDNFIKNFLLKEAP
jgi:hypothetical protein